MSLQRKHLLRDVKHAIDLDTRGQSLEAYIKYLQCISKISSLLEEEASVTGISTLLAQNTTKSVHVISQCVDRIQRLLDEDKNDIGHETQPRPSAASAAGGDERTSPKPQPLPRSRPQHLSPQPPSRALPPRPRSVSPLPFDAHTQHPTPPVTLSPHPTPPVTLSPHPIPRVVLPPQPSPRVGLNPHPTPPVPPGKPPVVRDRSESATAASSSSLEEAKKQNELLMKAYKARLARVVGSNRSNLMLTLQRQMAENIKIAKDREEKLLKRAEEKRRYFLEVASSKFSCDGTDQLTSHIANRLRHVYAKVLEYEEEQMWARKWRDVLEEAPENMMILDQLTRTILSTENHPVYVEMKQMQESLLERLRALVSGREGQVERVRVPYTADHLPTITRGDSLKSYKIMNRDTSGFSNESGLSSIHILPPAGHNHTQDDDGSDADGDGANDDGSDVDVGGGGANDDGIDGDGGVVNDDVNDGGGANDDVNDVDGDGANGDGDEGRRETSDKSERNPKAAMAEYGDSILDGSVGVTEVCDYKAKLGSEESSVLVDVQFALRCLHKLIIQVYEVCDNPVGREQCHASIEDLFFKPLHQLLITVFRLANHVSEVRLASQMTDLPQPLLPSQVGVRDSLCLSELGSEAYSKAVLTLTSLPSTQGPLRCLECLVKVMKVVCECVDNYYSPGNGEPPAFDTPNIGADDLVPIITFVILKSKMPEVVSYLHFIEDFTEVGYLLGEEGYCLITAQTALQNIIFNLGQCP